VNGGEPYEYALIRVVPRVERGEAMNAGVILYSQGHAYLGCRIQLDEAGCGPWIRRLTSPPSPPPWLRWTRTAGAAGTPNNPRA
jgi:hypothetical protein